MKVFPWLGILSLIGCSQSVDSFHVYDGDHRVRAANVELCGARTPLHRVGDALSGLIPISCEGDGTVHLFLNDGRRADCPVFHVTSLPHSWKYQVERDHCIVGRLARRVPATGNPHSGSL